MKTTSDNNSLENENFRELTTEEMSEVQGGATGSGKAQFSEFQITKTVDNSSPGSL